MTATQWFLIAIAPGAALFLLGTVGQFNQAIRGGSSLTPYRLMAGGTGLILLSIAAWLILATAQPWWVKLLGAPVPLLLSFPFFQKVRHPPHLP
jgi:hypothetical protein